MLEGNATVICDGVETDLEVGQLMEIDGEEHMQVLNTGEDVLRLFVTISPMGSESFAKDANI